MLTCLSKHSLHDIFSSVKYKTRCTEKLPQLFICFFIYCIIFFVSLFVLFHAVLLLLCLVVFNFMLFSFFVGFVSLHFVFVLFHVVLCFVFVYWKLFKISYFCVLFSCSFVLLCAGLDLFKNKLRFMFFYFVLYFVFVNFVQFSY